MRTVMKKAAGSCTVMIGVCFLLISTGWLAWVYHLAEEMPDQGTEAVSLVAGYLCQAAGIGLYEWMLYRRPGYRDRWMYGALGLYLGCLLPAVLWKGLLPAVIFGMLLNLVCGFIEGYYLHRLTEDSGSRDHAVLLGTGYSASILGSWLLSLAGRDRFYDSGLVLWICFGLALLAAGGIKAGVFPGKKAEEADRPETAGFFPQEKESGKLLLSAAALVFLFSVVSNCGFAFPVSDIEAGISVEFSRLFYAAGLLAAGWINEKSRRYGSVCAVTALVIPFVLLALRNEPVSRLTFWILNYTALGFFTVYRLILFCDLAGTEKRIFYSGLGLLIGRVGDAAGEGLCLLLSDHFLILLTVSSLFFAAAVFLYFHVFHSLYGAETKPSPTPVQEPYMIFNRFAGQYGLSAREREVLRFLLEEKSNAEIAEALCVSESTVKFHIHNLLQKTGSRNRVVLISLYASFPNG